MTHTTSGSKQAGKTRNTASEDASELVAALAALEEQGETPEAEAERAALEGRAGAVGMVLVSITITEEPIPDPLIERLNRKERDRLERVTQQMYEKPASLVGELEELVDRHPEISMLRNHLAGALQAAGEGDRAHATIKETTDRFPDYLYGFANWVMCLLSEGDVDGARALIEPEGGQPRLHVSLFDPGREVFHLTEVVAYSAMIGHYLIATERAAHAETMLGLCEDIAPEHPQTLRLRERLEDWEAMALVRKAMERLAGEKERREKRAKKKSTKKKSAKKMGAEKRPKK